MNLAGYKNVSGISLWRKSFRAEQEREKRRGREECRQSWIPPVFLLQTLATDIVMQLCSHTLSSVSKSFGSFLYACHCAPRLFLLPTACPSLKDESQSTRYDWNHSQLIAHLWSSFFKNRRLKDTDTVASTVIFCLLFCRRRCKQ